MRHCLCFPPRPVTIPTLDALQHFSAAQHDNTSSFKDKIHKKYTKQFLSDLYGKTRSHDRGVLEAHDEMFMLRGNDILNESSWSNLVDDERLLPVPYKQRLFADIQSYPRPVVNMRGQSDAGPPAVPESVEPNNLDIYFYGVAQGDEEGEEDDDAEENCSDNSFCACYDAHDNDDFHQESGNIESRLHSDAGLHKDNDQKEDGDKDGCPEKDGGRMDNPSNVQWDAATDVDIFFDFEAYFGEMPQ